MSGRIVILSGPSGVGKDTVIDAWTRRDARVERVVACTTRLPRRGEVEGVDYCFTSQRKFDQLVESGQFLEHKTVHGYSYGTPAAAVQAILDRGGIAVLKIDVQGGIEVMDKRPEALAVFLLPPDDAHLEQRIRDRALDDEETIARRLANARGEIGASDAYPHRIVNQLVEEVVDQLVKLTTEPGATAPRPKS